MGFFENLFGVYDDRGPASFSTEGYYRPTFDPTIMNQIMSQVGTPQMGSYGGGDLFGNLFSYKGGQLSMTPGAGPTYSDKMKRYIESTGKDIYDKTVLPALQRRGVLGRAGGQESREESLATKDWGRMLSQEAQKASATGEQLDITSKLGAESNFINALGKAMGMDLGYAGLKNQAAIAAANLAAGKNIYQHGQYYS